jgi:hypothetical protein
MPELVINGEHFAVRDRIDEWTLMKFAKSQISDDPMAPLAGMYDFINTIVKAEDRARLDSFMSGQEMEPGVLSEAIGTLVTEYAGRPTMRPSLSPDGLTPTPPSGRAASSSPGTVKVVSLSRPAGRSAVS